MLTRIDNYSLNRMRILSIFQKIVFALVRSFFMLERSGLFSIKLLINSLNLHCKELLTNQRTIINLNEFKFIINYLIGARVNKWNE